jgi:hypothetical protein
MKRAFIFIIFARRGEARLVAVQNAVRTKQSSATEIKSKNSIAFGQSKYYVDNLSENIYQAGVPPKTAKRNLARLCAAWLSQ